MGVERDILCLDPVLLMYRMQCRDKNIYKNERKKEEE